MLKKLRLLSILSCLVLTTACSTGKVLIQEVDDSTITTRIISLLIQDLQVNHLDIKVITDEGEVFLIGQVPDRATRSRAEEHARSIEKVWSVINHLRVGEKQINNQKSDLAIEASLLKEFSLMGKAPFLALAVHVSNSEVYLIGRVDSQEDRQTVLNTVYNQEGIQDVHEHLKIGSRLRSN